MRTPPGQVFRVILLDGMMLVTRYDNWHDGRIDRAIAGRLSVRPVHVGSRYVRRVNVRSSDDGARSVRDSREARTWRGPIVALR
jgi:hypothetical protein